MLLSLLRGDPAFSMLRPVNDAQWHARGGMPVAESWEPIEFTVLDGDAAEFLPLDCLTLNTGADGVLVSAYGRAILEPVLGRSSEFWPVRVMGRPYWWLNCMALVEALDRKKTDADWSVVSGDWGSFSWITTTRRLAFRPGPLKRAPVLFRVPEYPQGVLFAQEPLRLAVEDHGLVGFRFDPVWSAEEGGVLDPPGIGLATVFDTVPASERAQQRQSARDKLAARERTLGN